GKGRGEGEVPSTPAAAATLAAMMMTAATAAPGSTDACRPAALEEGEKGGTTAGEARESVPEDAEQPPAMAVGAQKTPQQPRMPIPETPSRREQTSGGLPMVTPRRRRAASQLLDLSKATPRGMIRGILGGNGQPAQAWQQHHQQQHQPHQRFRPRVTKLVENIEEETPRTLLKGACGPQGEAAPEAMGGTSNSTSAAIAAAA
ncbi:unnamed protein product, partial [Scytosiphon promiscuus]